MFLLSGDAGSRNPTIILWKPHGEAAGEDTPVNSPTQAPI